MMEGVTIPMRIMKGEWLDLLKELEMQMGALRGQSGRRILHSSSSGFVGISTLLKDALVLQTWIEKAGASSRVLQLLLAQLEAATATQAEASSRLQDLFNARLEIERATVQAEVSSRLPDLFHDAQFELARAAAQAEALSRLQDLFHARLEIERAVLRAELSSRLADLFHAQFELTRAAVQAELSSSLPDLCLDQLEFAIIAPAFLETKKAMRKEIGEQKEYVRPLMTFTALEFDLMRRELDLLPIEEDPWETFEEEAQMYAVVVSAVALFSLVYHYLAGYTDRGGTKIYSPGSLEFRATYISLVLFQGAYVWIKFRDVIPSSKRGGYRRPVTDKLSGTIKPSDKIEARYTPPRKSGNHNHIYLGLCATHEEAETKKTIAAFYFGGKLSRLDFDDGRYFLIPPMPTEQEQGLSVAQKREWVKDKVREVYEEIKALRAFDTNTVYLDDQINACHRSSLLAAKSGPISEGLSDVAFDLGFGVEEYLGELPEGIDLDFYKLLEGIPGSSEIRSYFTDAEPQKHLQEIQVQDDRAIGVTFENQCQYSSSDTEPLGTSYSAGGLESTPNVVHGSCRVVANGVANEGAGNNPQAVGGFPTMSPISALQPHSDAMAVTSDMVTPSASNLCPGISTSEQLALKVISLLEQLREKDTRIVELEREVERLRGTSHEYRIK
jgi:hypothetical protein